MNIKLRFLAFVLALVAVVPAAWADMLVEGPFARATPGEGKVGVAYMTLKNTGTEADSLVSASSPAAAKVELHTHIHEGGIMRMRPVDSIDVPAGKTVELQPGGLHLMLIDLKAPLKEGEEISVTLDFAKAGTKTVEVPVKATAAMAPHSGMSHESMPQGSMPQGSMPGHMKP